MSKLIERIKALIPIIKGQKDLDAASRDNARSLIFGTVMP